MTMFCGDEGCLNTDTALHKIQMKQLDHHKEAEKVLKIPN